MRRSWILLLLATVGCGGTARTPNRWLIPFGYEGWITLDYEIAGAPALPIEGGARTIRIPVGASLRTSSKLEYGWATDEYLYVDGEQQAKLAWTASGGGGVVWGFTVFTSISETRVRQCVFLGAEARFQEAGECQ